MRAFKAMRISIFQVARGRKRGRGGGNEDTECVTREKLNEKAGEQTHTESGKGFTWGIFIFFLNVTPQ